MSLQDLDESLEILRPIKKLECFPRSQSKQQQTRKRFITMETHNTAHRIKRSKTNKNVNLQLMMSEIQFDQTFISLGKNNFITPKKHGACLLHKNTPQNSYLNSKMKVLDELVSNQAKAVIKCEINKKLNSLKFNKILINCKNSSSPIVKKQQNQQKKDFLPDFHKKKICHQILDKVKKIMTQNPSLLQIKNKNLQLFQSLKEDIVNYLIKNGQMRQRLEYLCKNDFEMLTQKFDFSWFKFNELKKKRKPFYLFEAKSQTQKISHQIYQTIQALETVLQYSTKVSKTQKSGQHADNVRIMTDPKRRQKTGFQISVKQNIGSQNNCAKRRKLDQPAIIPNRCKTNNAL